jgi:DNA-binding transcriptional ArsR family regulator
MAPEPRPEVFAAISHPVRRRILDLLADDDRPVNAIASHFAVSRPAISQHLKVLLEAGLVAEQRFGRERRYRLVPEDLAQIYDWLAHYQRFWKGRFARLAEELAAEAPADASMQRPPQSRPSQSGPSQSNPSQSGPAQSGPKERDS